MLLNDRILMKAIRKCFWILCLFSFHTYMGWKSKKKKPRKKGKELSGLLQPRGRAGCGSVRTASCQEQERRAALHPTQHIPTPEKTCFLFQFSVKGWCEKLKNKLCGTARSEKRLKGSESGKWVLSLSARGSGAAAPRSARDLEHCVWLQGDRG